MYTTTAEVLARLGVLEKDLLTALATLQLIKSDLAGNEGVMDRADTARTLKRHKDSMQEHGPIMNDEQE